MNIAKILEEALRTQGVSATVSEVHRGGGQAEHDDAVEVSVTSHFTCGKVGVDMASDNRGELKSVTIRGAVGFMPLHGEDAHDFITAMSEAMLRLSEVPA